MNAILVTLSQCTVTGALYTESVAALGQTAQNDGVRLSTGHLEEHCLELLTKRG